MNPPQGGETCPAVYGKEVVKGYPPWSETVWSRRLNLHRRRSAGLRSVPTARLRACCVLVMTRLTHSASSARVVGVEALVDEVHSVEWVVVGDSGACAQADDADRVACQHCLPECLVSGCGVWVAVGSACPVCLGPALGALASPVVEVGTAWCRADAPAHVALPSRLPSRRAPPAWCWCAGGGRTARNPRPSARGFGSGHTACAQLGDRIADQALALHTFSARRRLLSMRSWARTLTLASG